MTLNVIILIRHVMEVLSKRLEIVVLISIKSYSETNDNDQEQNLASLEAHIQEERRTKCTIGNRET